MRLVLVALPGLIVMAAACSRRAAPSDSAGPAQTDAANDAAAPDAGDASVREPLGGHPWQFDLTDPTDASTATKLGCVSVPLGAREPRPIVVALHGGGDRPDWACGEWRGVSNGYPFLVCPRGPGASDAALGWSSPADTKIRIARAIAATKKIFGSWVRDAPIVLVGFSMGATQTALLARSEPETYRRVALSESAYAPEPAMAFAAPWAKGGGQRALFGCTTLGCESTYRSAARNVARNHVPARLNIAGTNQHGIWDVVVRSMRRDWPWLVDEAEGWEAYVPPVEETPLPGKSETFEPE
jgi:pimeloyl-ACP methyl ester carboxylesterase